MIGLLLILVLSVVVYNKYQAYRQTQLLKAQQLMHEQAQIVKQQRQALGNLPDQVLSKEGKAHLENRSNQSVAVKGSPITEKEYLKYRYQHLSVTGVRIVHKCVLMMRQYSFKKLSWNSNGR